LQVFVSRWFGRAFNRMLFSPAMISGRLRPTWHPSIRSCGTIRWRVFASVWRAGPNFTRLAINVERRYIVQSLIQPNFFLAEGYGEITVD
jgi:hypothetical protein